MGVRLLEDTVGAGLKIDKKKYKNIVHKDLDTQY